MLFFDHISSIANTVFIDPNWLLHDVFGRALSPDGVDAGGLNPRNGEVSWEDFKAAFADVGASPQVVASVLRSAHLCFEVPGRGGQRRLLLPSRLTEDVVLEEVWQPQADKWAGYGGRRLVIEKEQFIFPAGFLARVQVKLYASFGETLQLWRDAFHVAFQGVTCLGLLHSDREADVWVRWIDGAGCTAWEMMHEVRFTTKRVAAAKERSILTLHARVCVRVCVCAFVPLCWRW